MVARHAAVMLVRAVALRTVTFLVRFGRCVSLVTALLFFALFARACKLAPRIANLLCRRCSPPSLSVSLRQI
jgi:hypothetical protein